MWEQWHEVKNESLMFRIIGGPGSWADWPIPTLSVMPLWSFLMVSHRSGIRSRNVCDCF